MVAKMQIKQNTPPLLMTMRICTTTLEINLGVSQKTGNSSTSRPSYTSLWCNLKRYSNIPQNQLLNYIHSSFICNRQKLKTTQMPPQLKNCVKKICYMYTLEYYSAIKNKDIINFVDKWRELENIILTDESQSPMDMDSMYSLIS